MIEDLITHELYTQEDIAEMVSYIVENSHIMRIFCTR